MATSTHIVAGAAQGTAQAPVPPHACCVGAVRLASRRSPTFVRRYMRSKTLTFHHTLHGLTELNNLREGVRLGQVEGCDLCSSQPRTVGSLCITCDRRVCAEPQLREVSSDGKLYKSSE